jgi:hypothetical protein
VQKSRVYLSRVKKGQGQRNIGLLEKRTKVYADNINCLKVHLHTLIKNK